MSVEMQVGQQAKSRRTSASGLLRNRWITVVAASFAGGLAGMFLLSGSGGSFLSALVVVLAIYGISAMVSGALRILRGTERGAAELGRVAIAATSDAMVVVEDGEKILEANAAYLRLTRSRQGEAPTPDRFLLRIPDAREGISEMLRAVADETSATRFFPFDKDPGGRTICASVHPVDGPRRVLWALTLSGEEAAHPALIALPAPSAENRPADTVVAPAEPAALPLAAWESAPVGLVELDADRARLANTTFAQWLGYTLADWASDGVPLVELVPPADLATVRAALANEGAALLPVRLTRKDASAFLAVLRLGPAQAGAPRTAAVFPAGDLPPVPASEPKTPAVTPPAATPPAAAATARAEDLFFARSPLAMAEVDAAGRIVAANEGFNRLFSGVETVSLAGRPLAGLVDVREAPVIGDLLAQGRTAGTSSAPHDVTIAGAEGRSARLYASSLGAGTAVYAIDTTAQRALEMQFAQSQKMTAIGQLAGGVAHDFNNMLTAIIGFCDLLLTNHRPSDPSFPDIMQIKQNANRAAGLVRQLLAFSRQQTMRPEVIELTDVISDLSQMLRRLIDESITLDVQHARELWPVEADVSQLTQVIINLVVNARDAMPGGGMLTLRTANVPADACAELGGGRLKAADYVMVEVADTGTGIPPEIMDKIFEPFFSTKEVGKGTGLGLSTVYGVVEQMGGTILVASEVGKGSTFRVFLPRYVAQPKERADAQPAAAPDARPADLTGQGTILLVEDEDAVRAFASRALTARGYNVLTASSGVEALDVMRETGRQVDLVVSDVVMPEMDGPTLLRELRARDPALKVIFMSGYAEEAFARNLPPSEKFSFLPKPFTLKQLVAAVKDTMRG